MGKSSDHSLILLVHMTLFCQFSFIESGYALSLFYSNGIRCECCKQSWFITRSFCTVHNIETSGIHGFISELTSLRLGCKTLRLTNIQNIWNAFKSWGLRAPNLRFNVSFIQLSRRKTKKLSQNKVLAHKDLALQTECIYCTCLAIVHIKRNFVPKL